MQTRSDGRRFGLWAALAGVLLLSLAIGGTGGCAWMSYLGSTDAGVERGKVFFIGGAGPVGNVVGTFSVPKALRLAGWRGAIETFGWQSTVGGTLRDQMDRERNESQALRLAIRIQEYMEHFPGRPVHILAMSAGTGITTWALEFLPVSNSVDNVVFLASSLSRTCDLTEALKRIDGQLYVFSSSRDPILAYMMPVAGSVDREWGGSDAAGLYGIALPPAADRETRDLYKSKVRNRPYRTEWAEYGYRGLHTDSASEDFVRYVVAPLLIRPVSSTPPAAESPATRPAPGGAGRH